MTPPLIDTLEKEIARVRGHLAYDKLQWHKIGVERNERRIAELEAFKAMYVALKNKRMGESEWHTKNCKCGMCVAITLAEHAWEGRG